METERSNDSKIIAAFSKGVKENLYGTLGDPRTVSDPGTLSDPETVQNCFLSDPGNYRSISAK